MPQITFFLKANTEDAMDAAATAAKKEGFDVVEEKDTRMTIRKGSAALAIFLGWWVKYVVAEVRVKEADEEGEVKVTIEWTNAWWRFFVAMMQNPSVMKGYANAYERAVEKGGAEVLERKG